MISSSSSRPGRRRLGAAGTLALLLSAPAAISVEAQGPPPQRAVVVGAVENVYERPEEISPVDNQAILGEWLAVLDQTAGFARVRTRSGSVGWIPERAIRRDGGREIAEVAEVSSPLAHVYPTPSFTAARPLLTAPLGARFEALAGVAADSHEWVRAALPDGRTGYLARADVDLRVPEHLPRLGTPSDWIALGLRFVGAPYTWGGTTPLGFDCSGLVWRIFERHGVVLPRNSPEMCFREPRLVAVPFEERKPGDLLFFGTQDRIDHVAIWMGDGKVLQATAHGVPATQVTEYAGSPRLTERFRYARRLAGAPGAPSPAGLDQRKRAALEQGLNELARGGGAAYALYFKDLTSGATIRIDAERSLHAASTMKTAVMLEVLRRVDRGELRLEDELPVANDFRSLKDGSPFAIGLEADNDGPTAARLGARASLGFLVHEMIARSSNLATNLVLSLVGPAAVQRFNDELGAGSVKVRRCVEDAKAFEAGLNNETDAAGMGVLMEAAVRSPRLSEAARAKAWEILAAQVHNSQIPAGLHPQSGAVVAHKTGEISSVQHDAAVVRLPDGREYVLVLLADGFGADETGRRRVIETTRRMSRAAWEAMIAP